MLETLSPFDLLRECTPSESTMKSYTIHLQKFLTYLGKPKTDYDFLLALQGKELEDVLIRYFVFLKNERKAAHKTLCNYYSGIKKFYKVNDIVINDHKITRFFGEKKRTVKDIAYTHEEIQQMLRFCDERMRMVILLMSSTGIRLGAVSELKLKHLSKIENSYKFTIYENTQEEYTTFCTPECAESIDTYLEYRKRSGEPLGPESPLLRENFDPNDKVAVKYPRTIKSDTVGKLIIHILEISGLRTPNKSGRYRRQAKSRTHGFRKFANTNMVRAKLDVTMKERIIGHSTGLDDVYYTPEQSELYEEYTKAINALTINEENRLKVKLTNKANELNEYQKILADLQTKVDKILEKG